MARAAVKAKQAQKAKAQPAQKARARGRRKHASGGNPNQQLFFVRMRRRARPAYFILAFLFAATFAFLGVGSGSGGGLDQLFNNLNIFHHSGTSLSSALKDVEKHPNDPKAMRTLATAYESKGDTTDAISTLQQYTTLRPKDAKAFAELASLQMTSAQDYLTQYQNAYANEQLSAPTQGLLPSTSSPLGKALGANPIEQAASTQQNTSVNYLTQKVQLATSNAVASYQKVATLEPNNADAQFQLAQAAQQTGDTATAVAAYERYLKLNPNGSTAAQVRSVIKQLTQK